VDGVKDLSQTQREVVTERALSAIESGAPIPPEARFGAITNSGLMRIEFNPPLKISREEARQIKDKINAANRPKGPQRPEGDEANPIPAVNPIPVVGPAGPNGKVIKDDRPGLSERAEDVDLKRLI